MIAFVLLALLVFTIPWEKSVVIPGVGTLTKVIGVAAAVAGYFYWDALSARGGAGFQAVELGS